MNIEELAYKGLCFAAYCCVAVENKYLPIHALQVQGGAFAVGVLAQKALKPESANHEFTAYDLIPLALVMGACEWTQVSNKAYAVSTLVLGTIPIGVNVMNRPNNVPEPRRGGPPPPVPAPIPVLPEGLKIGETEIQAVMGNILEQPVVAIVNAANEVLLGGGGIDGVIHRAAGSELREECAAIPLLEGHPRHRIKIGDAVLTESYNIKNRQPTIQHIVHTVGPRAGTPNKEELLANAYRNSLVVAQESGIRSIAFPAISVGIFRYPFDEAQSIAFETVKEYVEENPEAFDTILFVYLQNDIAGNAWEDPLHQAWQEKMLPPSPVETDSDGPED